MELVIRAYLVVSLNLNIEEIRAYSKVNYTLNSLGARNFSKGREFYQPKVSYFQFSVPYVM
jgi:hypothetical protein